jgi:hypothetical protein
MPRQSGEDRAAAVWRTKGRPPGPPGYLSDDAAAVWRTITADRPPDYFRPSNYDLLASYCSLVVTSRELFRRLEDLDPRTQSISFASTVAHAAKLSTALTGFASKLRLCPSNEIDRKSRRQDQRAFPDDPLLGGYAVHGEDKAASARAFPNNPHSRLLGGRAGLMGGRNLLDSEGNLFGEGSADETIIAMPKRRAKKKPGLDAPPL